MAVVIEEKFGSPEFTIAGTSSNATITYVITGTDDEDEAYDTLVDAAALTFKDIPLRSYTVEPLTNTIWIGKANYSFQQNQTDGVSSFQFDTGGGTQHITQSIASIASYAPSGKTAPDFKGAIGVEENNVAGVDITVPTYNWSVTLYKADSAVDSTYKALLYNCTGKVNNGTWNGYAAGEVLFLGASGSRQGQGNWEITQKFAASPNITNKTIGDITGIAKKGWEYLWVRYQDTDDTTAKARVKRPLAVYIEQVYESADFTGLGV